MSLLKSVFSNAKRELFGRREHKLTTMILYDIQALNTALRQAGVNCLVVVGRDGENHQLKIETRESKEPVLWTGQISNPTPDILISFSQQTDNVKISSGPRAFSHYPQFDYTINSNFKYDEAERLTEHLSEKILSLLSISDLEKIHKFQQANADFVLEQDL